MAITTQLDPFNARNVAERLAESQQTCKAFGAGNFFDTETLLNQSTQCMIKLLEPNDGLLLDAQKEMYAEQVDAQKAALADGQVYVPALTIEVAEPLPPENPIVFDGEPVVGEVADLEDLLPADYASKFSTPLGGKVDEAVALQSEDAERDAAKERILAAETGPSPDNPPPLVAGNGNTREDVAHDERRVIAQADLDSQIGREDGRGNPEIGQTVAVNDGKGEQESVIAQQTALATEQNKSEYRAEVAKLETALKDEPPALETAKAPDEPQKLAGLTSGIAVDLAAISPHGPDRPHDETIAHPSESFGAVELTTDKASFDKALAAAGAIGNELRSKGFLHGQSSDIHIAQVEESAPKLTQNAEVAQTKFKESLNPQTAIA